MFSYFEPKSERFHKIISEGETCLLSTNYLTIGNQNFLYFTTLVISLISKILTL